MSSYATMVTKRLFRHKLAVVGMSLIVIMILFSIFADFIAKEPNVMNLDASLTPPGSQLYCARSKDKLPQAKYVYKVQSATLDRFAETLTESGKQAEVKFEKTGPAIIVRGADGVERDVPTNSNSLAPGDTVVGESKDFATFRSTRSVQVLEYLYRFKTFDDHLTPTREVVLGDLIQVEWVDEGVAYLVQDKVSGQRRLHKGGMADLTTTEAEVGQIHKPLLGTDSAGRDIAQRLVHGARISLYVGIVVELLSLLIGVPLGAMAGYYGGWFDDVIMRFTDIMFAFPGLLFAIAVMAIFEERSITNVFIALGLVSWPTVARIVRGQVISLKHTEFVEGAKAIGCTHSRIIVRHIMPNVVAPIVVYASLGVASAIMSEAGLSFLGIGIRPPTPSWGTMINEGFQHALDAPHVWLIPGIIIALVVLAFNFLGDGLRDALDPKLKI